MNSLVSPVSVASTICQLLVWGQPQWWVRVGNPLGTNLRMHRRLSFVFRRCYCEPHDSDLQTILQEGTCQPTARGVIVFWVRKSGERGVRRSPNVASVGSSPNPPTTHYPTLWSIPPGPAFVLSLYSLYDAWANV